MERIYHTWDKWECFPSFWNTTCPDGMKSEPATEAYREFLSDLDQFEDALKSIIVEWKYSCEHNLTNQNMNRIAWLGQASLAYAKNIPAGYRSGYNRLTPEQKKAADAMALIYLNKWLKANNYDEVDSDSVKQVTKQPKF